MPKHLSQIYYKEDTIMLSCIIINSVELIYVYNKSGGCRGGVKCYNERFSCIHFIVVASIVDRNLLYWWEGAFLWLTCRFLFPFCMHYVCYKWWKYYWCLHDLAKNSSIFSMHGSSHVHECVWIYIYSCRHVWIDEMFVSDFYMLLFILPLSTHMSMNVY